MEHEKYILKEAEDDNISWPLIVNSVMPRLKSIIVISIAFTSLIGIYIFLKPDYYVSKAISTSSIFKSTEISPILDIVSESIEEKSPKAIAKLLNIAETKVSSIKNIEVKDIQTTENQNYIFSIEIEATDTSIVENVYRGIDNYITANPYLNTRFKRRSEELDTLINKIQSQIKELYKFTSETKDLSRASREGIIIYPINLHSEIVDLEERLVKLKDEANHLAVIQYIQKPTIPELPSGPSRISIIGLTLILSFIGGVFLAITGFLFGY